MAAIFISGSSPPDLLAKTAGWMDRHSRADRKTSGTSTKATMPTTAQRFACRSRGMSSFRRTRYPA